MDRLALDGVYGPRIEVDLCFACHALWLDKRESLHLSPRGTLDLFRVLHEHRDDPRHAITGRLECPRCGRRLSLHQDIGKAGRFAYYACPGGDGRLTPFSEFLKEKQFVRSLNPSEQRQLRAEVKSVQCSGCGAPVDLGRGFQCDHCGSPITVLDADAVERTLRELDAGDARRTSGDPEERELRARALASMENFRTHPEDRWERSRLQRYRGSTSLDLDLLISSISDLFRRS
jgi:DNA-directed RNA polymerase subunit RPC12/RpoP